MRRVPFVMRADGSVSAMKATDLKEVADRDRRIRQLEAQCATLAAEVDRQQRLIDVVLAVRTLPAVIITAIDEYESSKSK